MSEKWHHHNHFPRKLKVDKDNQANNNNIQQQQNNTHDQAKTELMTT